MLYDRAPQVKFRAMDNSADGGDWRVYLESESAEAVEVARDIVLAQVNADAYADA